MKTIKRGCKGDEVITLQQALHITADVIFGSVTENAVKRFQKEHGLNADGIVGPNTWKVLGIIDDRFVDTAVIYSPLSKCLTKSPGRSIKYLAIHYTAGSSSAPGRALSMKKYWEQAMRASADFGVDDRDIYQFNPDLLNYKCWSVGDKKNPYSGGGSLYGVANNSNTISIEICSNIQSGASLEAPNHDGWYFTDEALNNAVKLAKILMRKFNIPIERVVRHYDISGKICPGVIGWNNYFCYDKNGKRTGKKNDSAAWLAFKKRLL